MARIEARLRENVPGEFFVDETCIDCATCRFVAPDVFAYEPGRGLSVVRRQPAPDAEQRALMALVACPTSSIGTVHHRDASPAVAAFPERLADDVYYCGFASEDSYGASSYLIARPAGNVLVDSPRAAAPLLRGIESLGGVRLMFLTHRDDVADHRAFRERFACERILHRRDVTSDTADVERPLEGDEPVRLDADLLAIPVPGHTAGCAVLLYRDTFLFTGDHLMGDEGGGGLHASRGVCWYSWKDQVASMERLLDHRFEWVLPGHGWRYRAPSAAAMRQEMEAVVRSMRAR
jgi:glyoxylase-like metal-dependent hydrolase (beta-lactamase superfamily II)/ferredoxin